MPNKKWYFSTKWDEKFPEEYEEYKGKEFLVSIDDVLRDHVSQYYHPKIGYCLQGNHNREVSIETLEGVHKVIPLLGEFIEK